MSDITTLMMAAAGQGGDYQISRSLRFNSADSAYLSRTPASAGNRKTWTWSGWVKYTVKDTSAYNQVLFGASGGGGSFSFITFEQSPNTPHRLNVYNAGSEIITTQVFRDASAWYHIVVAVDNTQATSSNRTKLYVNGVQVTALATANYPSLDALGDVNDAVEHNIGKQVGQSRYLDAYLADINFIDGQALTPSSFGETDAVTGVWKPIRYAGTYGTNGFHLDFSDNTSTTTLGYDAAGSNDWTLNNFSVTAGAGNDSLVDSPTRYGTDTGAGGEVRGNYCTLNPLSTTTGTYSQGNLRFVGANDGRQSSGTVSVSTGKWYWEVTLASAPFSPRAGNSDYNSFGFVLSTAFNGTYDISNGTNAIALADNGYYKNFSDARVDGGTAFNSGDVLSIAVDLDANTFTFRRNNTLIGTGTIGGTAGRALSPVIASYNSSFGVMDCNFGQRPFAYTAPSGFKALCTTNLPDPTVVQGDEYFNTVLYTGTGSSLGVTGVGFQPDFVWIKERNAAADHGLYDAVRGVQEQLESNTTTAETTEATGLTAFGTDGFTVGALAQLNTSADTYVAWNWKANGAGSSNTAGTISSTVSVNTTAGISIVAYTGNGVDGATTGHGLGVTPSFIILKNRDGTNNWRTYHSNLGTSPTETLYLNLTDGSTADTNIITGVSSSTMSLGISAGNASVNGSGDNYIAYCFAAISGFSAFGSYTGNGSADGTFVYTGFRPAFILVKNTNTTTNWFIWDNKTDSYNPASVVLLANTSDAEVSSRDIDILSNGFKARKNDQNYNSTDIMIYAAFAESPFKLSLAR